MLTPESIATVAVRMLNGKHASACGRHGSAVALAIGVRYLAAVRRGESIRSVLIATACASACLGLVAGPLAQRCVAQAAAVSGEAGSDHVEPSDASGNSSEYREAIKEALAEYQLGHWDEALALFQRAHALNPSARTLNGMGKVSFENRQYLMAIKYLRQALAETHHPVTAKQRSELNALISRAESFVVRFTVQLDPPTATLLVDATPAVLSPQGELLMDPGQHELVATAPGRDNIVREVRAVTGATEQLTIHLPITARTLETPTPAIISLPETPSGTTHTATNEQPTTAHSGIPLVTWIGAIAGGAGIALGTVSGIWAISDSHKLKGECPNGLCQPSSQSRLSTAKTMSTLSTVGFSVAAVGVAIAIIGLLIAPDRASADAATADTSSRSALSLTMSEGGAGVALAL